MSHANIAAAAGGLRVAISDGDSGFVRVLTKRLDRLGWEHRLLPGAVETDELVAMRLGALVVDLAHLGPHGWGYLERVTRQLPALPVIVCTGQSTVSDRVRALRMGADDWLTKPCHPEELIARIEAVMRRRRPTAAAPRSVLAGEIEVRPDGFQVFANGQPIDLTRREFELIALLSAAEGRVLAREQIYERVWGYTMARGDRSVDVFVRKLRLKLQQASPGWGYIHTHFGIGYRFAAEPAEAAVPPAGSQEAAPRTAADAERQPADGLRAMA
ncbi:MAG TPA: response regulator transcription factor [Solirubrobacteraceae bacterium]|jgi:DNA-binding response OmpR family regulator|nr:response regulator transcription factor [Solirubrobacteraceae bacterium]